jgi:hypothetical protein
MKPFRWNHDKNDVLKAERDISFEEIVLAIEANGILDLYSHPNQEKYPKQHILVVAFNNYRYLVPFIEESDYYFLKTVMPSRKAMRQYLTKEQRHDKI